MAKRYLMYIAQNYSYAILRPLQEAIFHQGGEVCWFLEGKEVDAKFLLPNERRLNTIAEVKAWQPDAVFVPGDRVPNFIPGLKVQVFHGLNESKRGNVYPERGLFDLYCTEGPERTKTLECLAKQRDYFKVVETGWVKLDSLFNYPNSKQHYRRPQILFASTFTPSLSCAEDIYSEIARLSQCSSWQWLVTLHPKMAKETINKYRLLESENLLFFENDKVIDLLHRADVMVCDNSSIFQEFLLLKKPVVTVNNREPLKSFINITESSQLKSAIMTALSPSKQLQDEINAYGLSITQYLDGRSAQRILIAVDKMLDSNWVDRKPLNLWRNLKMRKKLHFWRI